jgi:hypothetical protein
LKKKILNGVIYISRYHKINIRIKVGIYQRDDGVDSRIRGNDKQERWIPAYAGMTSRKDGYPTYTGMTDKDLLLI